MSSRSRSTTPEKPTVAQPDHFYGAEPSTPGSEDPEWLDPDDDPTASRGIPVFKPTMEEFADFEKYLESIERWGQASGIVKIIPPKEWSSALPGINTSLPSLSLKNPIEQRMEGRGGLFRQQNVEKRKVMSVREWAEMCNSDAMRAPSVRDGGRKTRSSGLSTRRTRSLAMKVDQDDGGSEHEDSGSHADAEDSEMVESGSKSPPESAANSADRTSPEPTSKRSTKQKGRDSQKAGREALDAEFAKSFDPTADWLPPNTRPEDYTPEYCKTLERLYWRNCGIGKPAWYGADMAGSLFTDETKAWNVAHLQSALTRLLPPGTTMPGVNTPYLYFGMWRATFAWHLEDMDLFSINYIHFGAPKYWYAIPQARASAMEGVMKSYFPGDNNQCSQFLRHKSYLVSPTLLSQSSCKPNTLVQHAGEFVVTFPRGYHAGFNLGFNCAESVNFALQSWIELGKKAKVCECVGYSVRIDVKQLLRDRGLEEASDDSDDEGPYDRKRKAGATDLDEEDMAVKKVKRNPSSAVTAVVDIVPPCCLCVSTSEEGLLRAIKAPTHLPPTVVPPDVWRAHENCALVVPETWIDEIDVDGGKEKVVCGLDSISEDSWLSKCVACTRHYVKSHGVTVRCSSGRCPKSYHISCAQEGRSLSSYRRLQTADSEVVRLDGVEFIAKIATPNAAPVMPQISTLMPMPFMALGEPLQSAIIAPPPPERNAEFIKKTTKTSVEIFCSAHNPVAKAAKKADKSTRIKRDLLALPDAARIKVKMTAGIFEATLLKVEEGREAIVVIWDNGFRKEFKWGCVVFANVPDSSLVGKKPIKEVSNVLPELKPVRPLNPPLVTSINPPPYVPAASYAIPFHSSYASTSSAQYQPPQQMAYGHTQSTFPLPHPAPPQWTGYSSYSKPPTYSATQHPYQAQISYAPDPYGYTNAMPIHNAYSDPHQFYSPMTRPYSSYNPPSNVPPPPSSSHPYSQSTSLYAPTWSNPPPAPVRSVPSQHHTLPAQPYTASHFGSHS